MTLLQFSIGDAVIWNGWPATVINVAHGRVWIRTGDGADRIVPPELLSAAQPEQRRRAE